MKKEILLKVEDIKIPNNGTVTLILYPNRDVYLGTVIEDVKIGTAIELPPHGALKDADELLASDAIDWGEVVWNGINNAPTVLEASR